MDKEMLNELRAMFKEELKAELEPIKAEIKEINIKVDRIEKKLDSVHDQTADLTEFRTETKEGIETIKKDISKLTNVTKTNCFEIADLKAVK
jgi:chromosome segregation ATPase